MAVREEDYLSVWEEYYDEKGRLMRTLLFSEIKQFGHLAVPSVLEVTPATKEGHKTIIRYKHLEFDIPVDDEIFSMRNLRSPK